MTTLVSFTLEAVASASRNYLERLVDADGLPYFNASWTDPPEAAHDWPDFGDVMARQLQGAAMARQMTGAGAAIEDTWQRLLLGGIDPGAKGPRKMSPCRCTRWPLWRWTGTTRRCGRCADGWQRGTWRACAPTTRPTPCSAASRSRV